MSSNGLLTPTGARAAAAAALAPQADDDPPVMWGPVDAVDPPALVLSWDDPWLTYDTACIWRAQLTVVCFAGRVEPDAGVETLERLASYVIGRLQADRYVWPFNGSQAPRQTEIANVPLLMCRLNYLVRVTIERT